MKGLSAASSARCIALILGVALLLVACDTVTEEADDACPIRPVFFDVGQYLSGSWSPQGLLAVHHRPTDSTGAFLGPLTGVYTMRPDGTGLTKVITQVELNDYIRYPRWSPDGQWIAFTTGSDLYKIRPDGSDLTRLTESPQRDKWRFAWSPDGRYIAYGTIMTPERLENRYWLAQSEPPLREVMFKMPPAAERCMGCEKLLGDEAGWAISHFDWARDGREFIYATDEAGKGKLHIVAYDTTTARVRIIRSFDDAIDHVAVAPDGQHIAFQSLSKGIGVVRSDGSGLRWLDLYGYEPGWAPGSRTILYRRLGYKDYPNHINAGYGELWAIGIDGHGKRQVTWSKHSIENTQVTLPSPCELFGGGVRPAAHALISTQPKQPTP